MLLKYLNEQLQTELTSLLEFTLRSSSVDDLCMREELTKFAHEEVGHIRLLTDMILRLGGEVEFSAPRTFPKDSLDAFFERCLAREEESIRRYSAVVTLLPTEEQQALLRQTIAEESLHREHLLRLRTACALPGTGRT